MSQAAERPEVTPDDARHLAERLREEGFDRLADWTEREADRMEEDG